MAWRCRNPSTKGVKGETAKANIDSAYNGDVNGAAKGETNGAAADPKVPTAEA